MFRGPLPALCEQEQWMPQKVAGGQTIASFTAHAKKLGFRMQGKKMLRVVLDGTCAGSIRGGVAVGDTGKLTY